MAEAIKISPPLSDKDVEVLKSGDQVLISGIMYGARDAAHKRLVELIDKGEKLPIDLQGQIIYYVGPSPARPGRPIGAAGPTTSTRMDAYSPKLIEQGLKGMIGKGSRSPAVIEAMKKHKAVYLAAVGGAGALLSRCIKKSEVVAYPELGAEAIYRFTVEDFPAIVVNDVQGNDLYEAGIEKYARR